MVRSRERGLAGGLMYLFPNWLTPRGQPVDDRLGGTTDIIGAKVILLICELLTARYNYSKNANCSSNTFKIGGRFIVQENTPLHLKLHPGYSGVLPEILRPEKTIWIYDMCICGHQGDHFSANGRETVNRPYRHEGLVNTYYPWVIMTRNSIYLFTHLNI